MRRTQQLCFTVGLSILVLHFWMPDAVSDQVVPSYECDFWTCQGTWDGCVLTAGQPQIKVCVGPSQRSCVKDDEPPQEKCDGLIQIGELFSPCTKYWDKCKATQ